MAKWVYLFKEGNAGMRNLLGGKGANLAEMTGLGLPVPQGFTVTTEACTQYYEDGRQINDEIMGQIMEMCIRDSVSAIRFSTLEAICDVLDCQPGDILEYRREYDPSLSNYDEGIINMYRIGICDDDRILCSCLLSTSRCV